MNVSPCFLKPAYKRVRGFVGALTAALSMCAAATQALPPDIEAPAPVGKTYTLTLWVRAQATSLLQSKEFTIETPVTIADFAPTSGAPDQRMVIRVMDGHFTVIEQAAGKWLSLTGFNLAVTPDVWFFLTYVRTPSWGLFYVDGDRVLRTRPAQTPPDRLQRLVFGHFSQTRFFPGDIAAPRLYDKALTDAEIRALAAQKPPAVR